MEVLNETPKLDKKYPLIYVEVPWEDKGWPIEKVRGLPVEKWVAPDALMMMFVPVDILPDTLLLLRTWGFEYAGLVAWRKPKDYLEGYWWRSHCEYILIGKRGAAKTASLLRHTLYEGSYSKEEYKPQAFRSLLSNSGLVAFGENTARLDLFGAYWQRRCPGYEKEYWDFWEE